jgi:hypothetical protein
MILHVKNGDDPFENKKNARMALSMAKFRPLSRPVGVNGAV